MQVFDHIFAEDRGLNRGYELEQSGKEHGSTGAGGARSSPATIFDLRGALVLLRHLVAIRLEQGTIAWAGLPGARSL